ncbi:class I SAM-dependent methyltransferase [Patescibacteria group bacterium]
MQKEIVRNILHQVKENYNFCAEEFSKTRAYNWKEIIVLSEKYVKNGDKLLDVGCGNGRTLQLLKNKDVEYIGIDNSDKLIDQAQATNSSALTENNNFKFITGDILNLPFKDSQFDVLLCVAVLHHIPSRQLRYKAITEMRRVLKTNGILIMSNWNLYQPRYRKNIFSSAIKFNGLDFGDIMLKSFSGKGKERYHHAFTKFGIKTLFKKARFKVKECYYEQNGQKVRWTKGNNLIIVGEK